MMRLLTTSGVKRVRAIFFVLFSLLFVAAPMLDTVLCAGEASAAQVSLIDDGSAGGPQPLPLDLAHCLHGHCHHLVPMTLEAVNWQSPGDAARDVVWLSNRIDSLALSSLERPPRI